MHLRKQKAHPSDEQRIRRECRWRRRWHESLNGLMYADNIVSRDGIWLEVFATEQTPDEVIKTALQQGRAKHDVVQHTTLICPPEWLAVDS